MKLKNRLKMAFLIIIVLPIFLAVMTGRTIIGYQIKSIEETYDIEYDSMQILTNPIQILNRVTRDVFNRIKLYAVKSPEMLENMGFISTLNSELADKYSFLVVSKNGKIVFQGNSVLYESIKENLSSNEAYNTEVDGGLYIGGKHPFLIKQQEFTYTDGASGIIYVLTDVNNIIPQIKTTIIQAVFSFILIILVTALILIFWLYRGIIHPLNILKQATKEMKDGNLNFSIHIRNTDEIGQLCEDFEEMRIHLKELIEVKMQYEADSRELLSNISHDLKTPLTTIKGYAEGIMDGVADTPEKLDRYVRMIYTKANDMSALVDELSVYSKLDSNSLPYNFKIISVQEFFKDCVEELMFELEVKNIKLTYKNDISQECPVIIDTEQLRRVIHNIIDNAVKYMGHENGTIEIRIKEVDDTVLVEIQDNGVGIDEKDLPHIFERFYRADQSRNSKKGGSGLGLAIVRKIIEEHGGRIWATSEVNQGTTISFTIMKWSDKVINENRIPKVKKEMILAVKD